MLWIKAFHIVFVVAWFAGLFYLPRLFIYHREATDAISRARFVTMERRLLAITHIGAVLAVALGISLLLEAPAFLHQGWMHAKLGLVVALVAYHGWCVKLAGDFRHGRPVPGSTWLRWFNEAPALLLVAIVCLVVVKPAF
ncbi:MAG: CopD family protein [Proteobacteria bacterium]|nr:CopD family protein [Pseudomonadota bacterium]